jgi:hypothetical protein
MVLLIYFSFGAQNIHIVMCKHFDHLLRINNEKKTFDDKFIKHLI